MTINAHDHPRISQDPAVMVGKPVIKGTRIPVETIIGYLAAEPDFDNLFDALPELTVEDVQAALRYTFDVLHDDYVRQKSFLDEREADGELLALLGEPTGETDPRSG